eukprot:491500_1
MYMSHNTYIYSSRLVSFYTFLGVTYLLFLKSSPQCVCPSISTAPINKLSSTQTLLSTDTKILPFSDSRRNLLTSNTTIVSIKRNHELIQNLYDMLPNNIVIIWHGLISEIPPGWNICDGTNGTPDLRDKFIIGGGNLHSLGDVGGSTNTTLSINQLPTHYHDINNVSSTIHTGHIHDTGNFSVSTQSGHTHTFSSTSTTSGSHQHGCSTSTSSAGSHAHTCSASTTSTGAHTHSCSASTSSSGYHSHSCSASTEGAGYHNHVNGNYGYLLQKRSDCRDTLGSVDVTCGEPDLVSAVWMTAQPDHTHRASCSTDSTGTHAHSAKCSTGNTGPHSHSASCSTGNTGSHNHAASCSTINAGSHAHSVSGTTSSSTAHSHSINGLSGNDGIHSHTVSGATDSVGNDNTINVLNPYYAAYYIMKIPYKFPTENPTNSPTLSPSISPTNNPSLFPTNVPSASPSNAPSQSPTNNPSKHPTVMPSSYPTSYSPTLTPSISPTLNPTSAPSIAPSVTPTLTPTLAPSAAPSVAPSLAPSSAPSLMPTLAPSIMPTNAPSLIPSVPPSFAPTLIPTFSPTSSPTPKCHNAKYQGEMIQSNQWNTNDALYGGESLVSPNCRFLLTMEQNGNLILRGLVGKYHDPFEKDEKGDYTNKQIQMTLYVGWETNTTIENFSGEATSRMMLKGGAIIVEELQYLNVPSYEPIELWKSNKDTKQNELMLELIDDGCLELYRYYGIRNTYAVSTPLWSVCADLSSGNNNNIVDASLTTTTISNITTLTMNEGAEHELQNDTNKNKTQLFVIWNAIISILLTAIVLGFLYFCVKRIYNDSTTVHVANAAKHIVNSNATTGEDLVIISDEERDHAQEK